MRSAAAFEQEPDFALRLMWSRPAELSALPIWRGVPAAGGVYVLWYPSPSSRLMRCLYVGSAHALQRRLLDLLSGAYGNRDLGRTEEAGIVFSFAPVERPVMRRDVTSFLYEALQPIANRRAPGGAPLAVNLPDAPVAVRAR